MATFFHYLVPVALAAVLVILILGVYNLARGGSPERSQKLMRMRVIFQLVALVVIMAALYFASGR